jgi:hypothetical protein
VYEELENEIFLEEEGALKSLDETTTINFEYRLDYSKFEKQKTNHNSLAMLFDSYRDYRLTYPLAPLPLLLTKPKANILTDFVDGN